MTILKALGRSAGSLAARGLCTRQGTALLVAGALSLAGGASLYLGRPAPQAVSRVPGAEVGQSGCGLLGSGYLPETNQFYCLPNGN